MDELAKIFLSKFDEKTATDLVCLARCSGLVHIGSFLGKYLQKVFKHNMFLNLEYSANLHYSGKNRESFAVTKYVLGMGNLTEDLSKQIWVNKKFTIDYIENDWNYYNPEIISKISNRVEKPIKFVTFTMTTCKRFNLFTQTMNTFLNCCTDIDLIDEWYCVDDNSSDEDRKKMSELYPFIKFIYKSNSQKGHPQSMNILRSIVKSPFMFHLEDDWKFFEQRAYISELMEVLGQNDNIGQALVNKNYSELASDNIVGGEFHKTNNGLRYYKHEYCPTQTEKERFVEKHGHGSNCSYWPHFSLRPGLLKTKIFRDLGEFNETVSHFENEYARRYVNSGYITAFLEGIYCIHIGRLTSQINDPTKLNAYILNGEAQFSGKEEKNYVVPEQQVSPAQPPPAEPRTFAPSDMIDETIIEQVSKTHTALKDQAIISSFVVNLDRRVDRWERMDKLPEKEFLRYNRFSAVDGMKLVPNTQLSQIFDNNDYNMRQGMVGCAMSHIQLYIDLVNQPGNYNYCILEDDIEFVPNFKEKFIDLVQQLLKVEWDICYLGHHLWKQHVNKEVYSKTIWPRIQKMNRAESLSKSMGGTIGYLISKNGARKLLEFINNTGMTNGIDTVQQKSADDLDVYYSYPHLVYSDCFRDDQKVDSDIQYNYTSLTVPVVDRLKEDIAHFESDVSPLVEVTNDTINDRINQRESFYYKSADKTEIKKYQKKCASLGLRTYTLADEILVMVSDKNIGQKDRYYHRFQKAGRWSVDDAIKYMN